MKYIFMINPKAGKGKGTDILIPKIKEYFKDRNDFEIIITEAPGFAKEKAKELAQSGEEITIFACGGEGTSFEVVNGIIGYDNVRLGVFPVGSANDFLKFFGEENKEKFMDIDSQVNGNTLKIDVIKADEFYCINGCSVGMDALVARDMSIFKNWPFVSGSMAYTLAILKTFLSKLGLVLEIEVDGESLGKKNCLFAVVANGPVYGGGYKSAPDAVPFDNKLDFTLVNTIGRLKVPGFLKHYKGGTHKALTYCDLRICRQMRFKALKEVPVNLDGEIVLRKEMTFKMADDKIKLVIPKSLSEFIPKY